MKVKKIVLANRFSGIPKPSDFQVVEEEIREALEDGGNVL